MHLFQFMWTSAVKPFIEPTLVYVQSKKPEDKECSVKMFRELTGKRSQTCADRERSAVRCPSTAVASQRFTATFSSEPGLVQI